jgi:hypothetical protein
MRKKPKSPPRSPLKKVKRLSAAETKAAFDRFLASTRAAWQEREETIQSFCRLHGADPDNEMDRHKIFWLLAWSAHPYLRPDIKRRRGAPRKWDNWILIERGLTLRDKGLKYESNNLLARLFAEHFPTEFKKTEVPALAKQLGKLPKQMEELRKK